LVEVMTRVSEFRHVGSVKLKPAEAYMGGSMEHQMNDHMIYSTRTASHYYWRVFLVVLTVAVVAVGCTFVFEALSGFGLWAGSATGPNSVSAGRAGLTFGLMLVSLAGVVLSVVLPDRIGKALLLVGAAGFFGCLTLALLGSVRT
jgi:hypothetical protein